MTNKELRNRLEAIQVNRKDTEILGFIGDLLTGKVEVSSDVFTHIYATIAFTGQVIKIRNFKFPNRLRMPVKIGYPPNSNVLQVIEKWEGVYPDLDLPEVPKHNHTWGKTENPAWIRKEQILELLPSLESGLKIRVNSGYLIINGVVVALPTTTFDMTSYVPVSGARWVSVSCDVNRNFQYTLGTLFNNKGFLEYSDVPNLGIDYRLLFSCKMYEGQTEFVYEDYMSDIFDPRFMFGGEVGGASIDIDPEMTANSDDVAPSQKAVVSYVFDRIYEMGGDLFSPPQFGIYRWVADGIITDFELTDVVDEITSLFDNSLLVDPFEYELSSDGTKVIFSTPPTNEHVIVANGLLRSL